MRKFAAADAVRIHYARGPTSTASVAAATLEGMNSAIRAATDAVAPYYEI